MRAKGKGVSSVIGMAFLSILLIGMLLLVYESLRTMQEVSTESREASRIIPNLPQCIIATWEKPAADNITVTIENQCGEPANITAVSVAFEDSTVAVIDKNNLALLPLTIPPGGTLTLDINITQTLGTTKNPVGVSLAAMHLATGITVPIEAVQPPPTTGAPATNATYTLLPTAYSDYTATWLGTLTQQEERRGTITTTNLIKGTGTISTSQLENRDSITATITSQPTSINLVLVENNTIYYDPFTTNPITSGRMTVISGSWTYSSTLGGYIEQTDSQEIGLSEFVILSTTPLPAASNNLFIMTTSTIVNWGSVIVSFFPPTIITTGSMDINLADTLSAANRYTLTAERISSTYRLAIYINGGLASSTQLTTIQNNVDYLLLVNYDRSSPLLKLELYDEALNFVNSVQTNNIPFTANYPGFSTIPSVVRFYYLYITEKRDPRFFYVANVPPGWSLEFRDSNNNLYTAMINPNNSSEWIVRLIRPNNLKAEPVVYGTLYVNDSGGNPVAQFTGNYWGGSVYKLDITWEVSLEVETTIDLSGVPPQFTLFADALASASVPGVQVSLYAFNYATSSYDLIASDTGGINSLAQLNAQDYMSITGSQGTVKLRLDALLMGGTGFDLYVDSLNAFISYSSGAQANVLLVARGGTSFIDVYQIDDSTSPPSLVFNTSIDAYTVFDGTADIAGNGSFIYLVNSTGLYKGTLAGTWTPLSSTVSSGGQLVRLEYVPGPGLLAVYRATGEYFLVDPSTGSVVAQGVMGIGGAQLEMSSYTASWASGDYVYLAATYSANLSPVLVVHDLTVGSFGKVTDLGSYRVVGLTGNAQYLYILHENGPLLELSLQTLQTGTILLPFYPIGPGDRMEYYSGYLFIVRGEGTRDLLVVQV